MMRSLRLLGDRRVLTGLARLGRPARQSFNPERGRLSDRLCVSKSAEPLTGEREGQGKRARQDGGQ